VWGYGCVYGFEVGVRSGGLVLWLWCGSVYGLCCSLGFVI
jgi:hypothetical protein